MDKGKKRIGVFGGNNTKIKEKKKRVTGLSNNGRKQNLQGTAIAIIFQKKTRGPCIHNLHQFLSAHNRQTDQTRFTYSNYSSESDA